MEKCLNCQYYDRRAGRPTDGRATMWGPCRKHSPHLNPVNTKKAYQVEGVWPLVRDDDWCGEWRAVARVTAARSRIGSTVVDMPLTSPSPAAVEATPHEESAVALASD